jgi:polysaccharide export outer membrane protein
LNRAKGGVNKGQMKLGKWCGGVVSGCLGLFAAGLLLTGCHTGGNKEFSDIPGLASSGQVASSSTAGAETSSGAVASAAGVQQAPNANDSTELIRPGETVIIAFSDVSTVIPPMELNVTDDGAITLIYNQTFKAAGKTTAQLAREIRLRYVPAYFVNLTVTVSHLNQTRFYYVGGEVKVPGRQIWLGPITVTRAIQSAGDFTDFANKRKVTLVRADGRRTQKVNCVKALEDPQLDPPVYPGDKISVPRKFF